MTIKILDKTIDIDTDYCLWTRPEIMVTQAKDVGQDVFVNRVMY